MAFDTIAGATQNNVQKIEYVAGVVDGIRMRGSGGILDRLLSMNGFTTEAPGGQGRQWYYKNVLRAAAGGIGDNRDLGYLNSKRAVGALARMRYSEIFFRSNVAGDELRDPETVEAKYISTVAELSQDIAETSGRMLEWLFLGDGQGVFAEATNVAPVTITPGNSATISVSYTNGLYNGQIVEIRTPPATINGRLRVTNVASKHGPGNVVFTNEGTTNVTVTLNDIIQIPFFANQFGHGMQYIISDGTEAPFATYPRAGSSNIGIDRSDPTAPQMTKAIVVPANGNGLTAEVLDSALQQLMEQGNVAKTMVTSDGRVLGYDYPIVCTYGNYMSLQKENRSVGRAFTIFYQGAEDNGVREGTYSGKSFVITQNMQDTYALIPQLTQFECSIQEPQIISGNSFNGMFDRISERDEYEHIQVLRWHLAGFDLGSSAKIGSLSSPLVPSSTTVNPPCPPVPCPEPPQ